MAYGDVILPLGEPFNMVVLAKHIRSALQRLDITKEHSHFVIKATAEATNLHLSCKVKQKEYDHFPSAESKIGEGAYDSIMLRSAGLSKESKEKRKRVKKAVMQKKCHLMYIIFEFLGWCMMYPNAIRTNGLRLRINSAISVEDNILTIPFFFLCLCLILRVKILLKPLFQGKACFSSFRNMFCHNANDYTQQTSGIWILSPLILFFQGKRIQHG